MADSKKKKPARASLADLRALSVDELGQKLADERKELLTARFKHAAAQLEKTSELKAMKKQVARISTILTEKEQRS